MNDKTLLQNVYLFESMPTDQVDKIAAIAHAETLAPQEEIFGQDDKASAFYLIKSDRRGFTNAPKRR